MKFDQSPHAFKWLKNDKTYRGFILSAVSHTPEIVLEIDNLLVKVLNEQDAKELIDKILDNSFDFKKEKK
jgi:hypothetical protein